MARDLSPESISSIDKAGLVAAFSAALAWAFTGIFIRYLNDFSAAAIIAGRCGFALLGAGLLLFVRKKRISPGQIFGSVPAWQLSLLMVGYYILAVIAFQFAPVGEVALIISTSPLFALIYRRVNGIPITVAEGAGACIAIVGVGLVVAAGAESPTYKPTLVERLTGDALALAGSAVMAGYSILYRNVAQTGAPSSRAVTFLIFLVGTLLLSAWLIVVGNGQQTVQKLNTDNLLLFAGLGLGSTVLPTVCYSFASHKLSSLLATSIRLLTPLLSALLAILLLNEIPGLIFWPGTLFILAGLYLIITKAGR